MSSTRIADIPIWESVRPLAETADVWFCDIWGVIHNGLAPYADAIAACKAFRAAGGTVILVSNAPRPDMAVARQLAGIGVDPASYDAIVSSGDVTREAIARRTPLKLHHIGPARDHGIFDGLTVEVVDEAAADLVLCSGLRDDTIETAEDYREELSRIARRRLPFVCANPDIKVERGAKIVWCAGALAELFELLGGQVEHAGKPHAPIYRRALMTAERLRGAPVDPARVLAIGDGIRTDILGASNAGLASVYIASAVHLEGALTSASLTHAFEGYTGTVPLAALPSLRW